ncbi:hypothetical protein Efla_005548 [Eimeria flavescens]
MTATGTLSDREEPPAGSSSRAAEAEAAVAAATAAADALDADASAGHARGERGDSSTMDRTPDKESSAWGSPEAEKHSTAAATADDESPDTHSGGSRAAREERHPRYHQQNRQQQREQQEQQQQEQEEESEGDRRSSESAGVTSCAVCNKCASSGNQAGDSAWVCEACILKQEQQQRAFNGEHRGGATDQRSASSEEPTDSSHFRDEMTEANEYAVKTEPRSATSLSSISSSSSSSVSGGSGAGGSASRGRGSPGGAAPAAAAAAAAGAGVAAAGGAAAGSRKCIDEGSVRRHVVPVGPRHQVPCLPPFFLEARTPGCCCGGESAPVLDPSLSAKLVYSPSSLERVRQRRLAEGLADRAICSEGDMEAFMQQCAKNWKANKPGWQPFSPEFAFKLLHYAGYDPEKALQLMEDPQFPFQLVCDGPIKAKQTCDGKQRLEAREAVRLLTSRPATPTHTAFHRFHSNHRVRDDALNLRRRHPSGFCSTSQQTEPSRIAVGRCRPPRAKPRTNK